MVSRYFGSNINLPAQRLLCRSPNERSVHVQANCQYVYLDGTEDAASVSSSIAVSVAGQNSPTVSAPMINISVWQPSLPVTIISSKSTLIPIAGWHGNRQGNCVQMYERSNLQVYANFSNDGETFKYVPINGLVRNSMRSNNTGVASISGDIVSGRSVGSARIYIHNSNRNLSSLIVGYTDVAVAQSAVRAGRLTNATSVRTLEILQAMDINMSEAAVTSPFNTYPSRLQARLYNSVLRRVGQEVAFQAVATLSDGSRMSVGLADNLQLNTTRRGSGSVAVMTDSGYPRAVAVSSASGDLVEGVWSSCDGSIVGSTNVSLTIDIAAPSEVRLEGIPDTMTPIGDVMSARGFTSTSTVSVHLVTVHPNGDVTRQDVSTDHRTVYSVAEANGRLQVCSIGGRVECTGSDISVLQVPSGASSGVAVLNISFQHLNLTVAKVVTVVGTSFIRTRVTPYPIYSGSSILDVNRLYRYACVKKIAVCVIKGSYCIMFCRYNNPFTRDAIMQQGVISVYAVGPDGGQVDISTNVNLRISLHQAADAIAITRRSRVLTVSEDGLPLTQPYIVRINSTFSGFEAEPVSITATNESVSITRLISLSFDGQSQPFTLRGVVGHTERISFSAIFDDTRQYPNIVSPDFNLLPGLFTYVGVDNDIERAYTVTENDGLVVLRNNSNVQNTIRVNVQNSQVSVSVIHISSHSKVSDTNVTCCIVA